MRRLPVFVLIALAAFAAGGTATWLLMRHGPTVTPASAPTGESDRKVLYWYDPMVPQQHFNAPGKSPFMDMQLLPRYADGEAGADAGVVRIDPRVVQNLGVRTAHAERGRLTHAIRATGALAFDERATTVVQSRVAGIVERLAVRAPLSAVKRGETLLTLIAPDWTAAQEEYLALRRAQAHGLDALRAAARQRLLLLGMDAGQVAAVERSGRAQTRIAIAAPRDGVVVELAVREGATVMAGAPLMTINGLDTVWMNAAIAEADSGRVAAGAQASATLAAFPGETFAGTVEALLPDLDPATRTQKARIVLRNPQHRLAPGMFASVEIAAPAAPESLLVPDEALIATGTRNVVIVAEGGGRFRAQEVRIGERAGGKVAVLDGLREGDAVVLSGQFLIDSEASLAGALARLGASEAVAPPKNAPARREHDATGVVSGVDGERWTIATDAIAALDMEAMTMTFVCPASVPTDDIRVGQRVGFSFFRNADGRFEITKIAVLDAAPARGHKP